MKHCLLLLILGWLPLVSSGQERTYSAYYHQRASFFESLPVSAEDIVFLGNSITDGGEWAELFPGKPVKNRGISGDVALGVYDRLESITKGKPAKIFLLIGINDLARGTSTDTIVSHITMIAERIQKETPQTTLYIQSVLPVNDCYDMFKGHTSRWHEVKEINKGLQSLAEKKGITYIDLYSHFVSDEPDKMNRAYSNDGLHLMGEGYRRWAEVVMPYVEESITQTIEQSVFTPEQLKEDADYFFTSLFERQPNPYEYSSLPDFEDKKDSIYNLLDKPMTADEFMWIIGSINSYLSYHSGVNLKFNKYVVQCFENAKEQNLKLFPRVSIREDKIFTKINNQDRELTSINGIPADSILRFMQSYYNDQLSVRRNTYFIESFFALWADLYFNIKPPFRITYNGNPSEVEIEGISADEFMDFSCFGIVRQPLVKYAIYPSSSTAIFTSHVFNRNRYTPEEVESQLAAFRDSVNKYDIKYLFLDLSKNTGGSSLLSYPLLNIVSHDTIFEQYSSIQKKEFGNQRYFINTIASPAQLNLYEKEDKQLFVLQGTNTASAANYLCRLFKRYQLGVLVGQPSGEPTVEFTASMRFVMPNTKLNFIVAGSLIDFSEYFPKEEKDFPPDMHWDVDYTIDFEEKELIKIAEQWNRK